MSSSAKEIKRLLKGFCYYKTITSNGESANALKEKISAIENVLNKLDSADRLLVDEFFIKGTAIEDITKFLHISKSTIYRRVDAIIDEIKYCYSHIFG